MYTNLDIDAMCPQPVIARSHELVFIDLHKPGLDSRGASMQSSSNRPLYQRVSTLCRDGADAVWSTLSSQHYDLVPMNDFCIEELQEASHWTKSIYHLERVCCSFFR